MRLAGQGISVTASFKKLMDFMAAHNMELKNPLVIRGQQYKKLGYHQDENGTKTNLDLIAKMLQSFLDVGNDPIVLDLGLTQENVTHALTMMQLGIPANTIFEIINDPQVKKFFNDNMSKKSQFSSDSKNPQTIEEYLREKKIKWYSDLMSML